MTRRRLEGGEGMPVRPELVVPLYDPTDAARLVGPSSGQVRRWLLGYHYKYRKGRRRQDLLMQFRSADGRLMGFSGVDGPIYGRERAGRQACFLDLVELRAAKLFLDHGLSAQRVRRAFNEARSICQEPFPFASRRVFLMGPRIFLELVDDQGLLELLTNGQWVIRPLIEDYVEQLEFDNETGLAEAWWPLGRKEPVVITPVRAFGAPVIEPGNLKTSVVYDLYLAEGKQIEPVRQWFGLDPGAVRAAVRYEEGLDLAKAA